MLRTANALVSLGEGGDGVAEVPAEIGRGAQIDGPANQSLQLELDGGDAHEAGDPIGLELD
jgi:hypothetical protein